jgi:hypothetical protein
MDGILLNDKQRHDLLHALRVLTFIVEFIDEGMDFSQKEGQEILEEARRAKALLQNQIPALINQATKR